MKAREIMTSNVISVRDTNTVEDAARLLTRHRISGMPVVTDDGVLVGLVTEYDLIAKQGDLVRDIMTSQVVSVGADVEVEEVAHLLTNQRIRRVPVLDNGRLVGILSRADLVRQIAMRWVCSVCGEMVRSPGVPDSCPRCGARGSFTHEVEPPGM